MRSNFVVGFAAALCAMLATTVQAAPIDTGGKTALSGQFSVLTQDPDTGSNSNTVLFSGQGTRITQSGRFEFGAGAQITGNFTSGGDSAFYFLFGTGRINTDPMGPEENVILYLGVNAGVSILRLSGGFDDELFSAGPKAGIEYYFTPKVALQLEDYLAFDTEDNITNQFTIGIKVLFDNIF